MDSVSWLFLVILTLTRLIHKEVLSGDYIIGTNIELNERRIKYGGTEVKKEAYMERKKEKKEVRKEKHERGSKKVVNVQECTLSYRSQSPCKQPTLQFQSAFSRV
jgi:DNA modification methylase